MSFTEFEADILEILNEDELTAGLVRRKINATIRRIESLWDFPYMFLEDVVVIPVGNAPINHYNVQWKTIYKAGIWCIDSIDTSLPVHGGGATGFEGFLQKITNEDIVKNHFVTLNNSEYWGTPLFYQRQHAGFVEDPLQQGTVPKIFRTQFQLYPPSDVERRLTLIGYRYSDAYTDDNANDNHWLLTYGRDLLEAWTILSLTPALQDATLAQFYSGLVESAQEVLLKSEANSDWEGLDETAEYVGETDI